jgi:uncharacterized membrane protein YdjX (TVP38/TMEM64 family)
VSSGRAGPVLGRVVLVAFVAVVLGSLYWAGFFEFIQKPEEVREAFRALGAWGPVLYVVSFALLEPFFVPGLAFMLPAAFVWDYPQLMLLSWIGATGSGVIGFAFARYIGRGFVESHLPTRFRRYDKWLSDAGLRAVIVARLIFFITPPVNWLFGLSRVPLPTFVIGTAIGFLPGIAVLTYLFSIMQETVFEWLEANTRGFVVGLAIILASYLAFQRVALRRNPVSPAPGGDHEPGENGEADETGSGS